MPWQQRLLIGNGVFLMVAASALFTLGTLGHSFGVGPLAAGMAGASDTLRLTWTENFLLAVLFGVLLTAVGRTSWDRRLAMLAAGAHAVMLVGNLVFWQGFVDLGAVGPATAATAAHGIFFAAEAIAVMNPPR